MNYCDSRFPNVMERRNRTIGDRARLFSSPSSREGHSFVIHALLFRENTVFKQVLKSRHSAEATRWTNEQPQIFGRAPDSMLRTDATIVASQRVRNANAPKTRQASSEAVLSCCFYFQLRILPMFDHQHNLLDSLFADYSTGMNLSPT